MLEDSFLALTQRRQQQHHHQQHQHQQHQQAAKPSPGGGAPTPTPTNSGSSSFSTRQLAINAFRVKRALQPPPLLLLLLDAPGLAYPLLLLWSLRSALWAQPLLLLAFTSLNGLLVARAPTSGFASVEAWPGPLVERVLQMENTSAPGKIRKLRKMAKWLQDQLGLLASGMERCVMGVGVGVGVGASSHAP